VTAVVGRALVAVSSLHPVTASQLNHLGTSQAADEVDVLTTSTEMTATPLEAATELADRVADALDSRAYDALILVGGDGAAAILTRLAVDRIVVDGTIDGCCPTGIINGGPADGLRLVTKSGGFGDPTTLATVLSRLRPASAHPRPNRQDEANQSLEKEAS
jgi:uncharacterized protein YgbK (DUF1537 family)